MADIVYGQDDRMYGVTGVAAARTNTRLILANPVTSTLVNVAFSGSAVSDSVAKLLVLGMSVVLSEPPKVVASSDDYVFAAGKNTLYRTPNSVALDTDGFAVTTFVTECIDPRWIVHHNGFVFLPWDDGGLLIYDEDGVEVLRIDRVLGQTSLAAWDALNDLLIVVDSQNARGVTLTLTGSVGVVDVGDEFALTGCKGITAISPAETYLAIACEDRLVLFANPIPSAPTYAGMIRPAYRLNYLVKVDTNAWWIASDSYLADQADRFDYRNSLAIFIDSVGVFAISATTGRVIGEADFVAITPDDVVDEVDDSFYILSEAGERIIAEDDSPMIQEEAP